jgi:hypothetical protein
MTDFNAAAVTHVLSTAGEIIIASKRIRLSWFNAGWMLRLLQIFGRAGALKKEFEASRLVPYYLDERIRLTI